MTHGDEPTGGQDVRSTSVELRAALTAFARARDWEDPVREAWRAAADAAEQADDARRTLVQASQALETARAEVARVQALQLSVRGRGPLGTKLWHQASATLVRASVDCATATAHAEERERISRILEAEYERQRDSCPYVAALWRACVRSGASDSIGLLPDQRDRQ